MKKKSWKMEGEGGKKRVKRRGRIRWRRRGGRENEKSGELR